MSGKKGTYRQQSKHDEIGGRSAPIRWYVDIVDRVNRVDNESTFLVFHTL